MESCRKGVIFCPDGANFAFFAQQFRQSYCKTKAEWDLLGFNILFGDLAKSVLFLANLYLLNSAFANPLGEDEGKEIASAFLVAQDGILEFV